MSAARRSWRRRAAWRVAVPLALVALPRLAFASNVDAPGVAPETPHDVRTGVPTLAYTYQAGGVPAGTYGAQGYGAGVVGGGGVGENGAHKALAGGGAMVWGSPVDRLTLVGDASRDLYGMFAPSAAAIVRLVGDGQRGFALSLLGKYKVEGFAFGPKNELESEIESGILMSYAARGWHADLNAITGFGLGDDGEIDTEGRLRLGRDLGDYVRVGIDGQARLRAMGTTKLPGGRTADFAAGPQVLVGSRHFFAALTGGPTTMAVLTNVGWTTIISVGGTSF